MTNNEGAAQIAKVLQKGLSRESRECPDIPFAALTLELFPCDPPRGASRNALSNKEASPSTQNTAFALRLPLPLGMRKSHSWLEVLRKQVNDIIRQKRAESLRKKLEQFIDEGEKMRSRAGAEVIQRTCQPGMLK